MAEAAYDRIGVGYTEARRADPRIAAKIDEALGVARSVLNVGAGTGSYEPAAEMIHQLFDAIPISVADWKHRTRPPLNVAA